MFSDEVIRLGVYGFVEDLNAMMGKRLFWREFWLLWGAGVITGAIVITLVRIPTTPLALLLLLKNHSQKPLLLGTEAIETPVELAIAVSCGLFAAHSVGVGAPIVEKWLRGEPIRSQLRALLVPSLLVGTLIAVISIMPNLSVFHPNRQLAHEEAERISESPAGGKLGEKLAKFTGGLLTPTSFTFLSLDAAIRGELFWRLFLVSGIALIIAKIRGARPGPAGNGVLFSAVFAVAAINAIASLAWQGAITQMILSSLGNMKIVQDPLWLVATRTLLRIVPANVGFGWLYIRRGLESAILSAFVAQVVAHVLVVLVVVHLV